MTNCGLLHWKARSASRFMLIDIDLLADINLSVLKESIPLQSLP
jgi:hypothetical protein